MKRMVMVFDEAMKKLSGAGGRVSFDEAIMMLMPIVANTDISLLRLLQSLLEEGSIKIDPKKRMIITNEKQMEESK